MSRNPCESAFGLVVCPTDFDFLRPLYISARAFSRGSPRDSCGLHADGSCGLAFCHCPNRPHGAKRLPHVSHARPTDPRMRSSSALRRRLVARGRHSSAIPAQVAVLRGSDALSATLGSKRLAPQGQARFGCCSSQAAPARRSAGSILGLGRRALLTMLMGSVLSRRCPVAPPSAGRISTALQWTDVHGAPRLFAGA